jgi:hypothetical protein
VFVAARLLEEPGRTVESVAHQLEFDSPSGLRNTLRRYTGHAPAALRASGGLRCALRAFAAACAARRDASGGNNDDQSDGAPPAAADDAASGESARPGVAQAV